MFCSVSCAAHLADMPGIKGQSRSNNMCQTGRWALYCISDVGVCYTHTHTSARTHVSQLFFLRQCEVIKLRRLRSSCLLPTDTRHSPELEYYGRWGRSAQHQNYSRQESGREVWTGTERNGTEGNIAATSMSFLMARNYICNCPQPKERMSFTMCNAFTFNVSWSFHEIAQLESL